MIKYHCGNHAINDHCWLDSSGLFVASGNLLKKYEKHDKKWLNTLTLKPFNSTILRISHQTLTNNDIHADSYQNYIIISGLKTISVISLSDYSCVEYTCDFWLLEFKKVDELVIVGLSDLSVHILSLPNLEIIRSLPGKKYCLATSLAINLSNNEVELIFTAINSLERYKLSLKSYTITAIGATKSSHRGIVFKSRFICNGTYLLTASEDRSVIIWSVGSELSVKSVLDHPAKVWDGIVVGNSGCEIIATCGSDGKIYFWDFEGKLLQNFSSNNPAPITNLSAFGKYISAGSQDGNLCIKQIIGQNILKEYIITADDNDLIRNICFNNGIMYILTNNGQVCSMNCNQIKKLPTPKYLTGANYSSANISMASVDKIGKKLSKLKYDLNAYSRICNGISLKSLEDRFKKTVEKFKGITIRLERSINEDLTNVTREIDLISKEVTCETENAQDFIILQQIERFKIILKTLESLNQLVKPRDYLKKANYSDSNLNVKEKVNAFVSCTMNVGFDRIFIGDLYGQIHVFPVNSNEIDCVDNEYKIFKCFQHRVGNIYLPNNCKDDTDVEIVCVDNLANISTISLDKLSFGGKIIPVKSFKLPFIKKYGKITSGLILPRKSFTILGDEFGNVFYGQVPNIERKRAHNGKITCIKYNNNNLYTSGTDGNISIWTLEFQRMNDIKIENLQQIYHIEFDESSMCVLGFRSTSAIYYNVSDKVELWTCNCGGPRRPFSMADNGALFAYSVGCKLNAFSSQSEAYSINPWFPYGDLYSGLWISDDVLMVGGRDCYIRLVNFPPGTLSGGSNHNNNNCLGGDDFGGPNQGSRVRRLTPILSKSIRVLKTLHFLCPIRCMCYVKQFIVVGGAGVIKLFSRNLEGLDLAIISDESELLQIRVNFLAPLSNGTRARVICGLSNSTIHIYGIINVKFELEKKIDLEYTPLSIFTLGSCVYIGTNRGFVAIKDFSNNFEQSVKVHQSGINGIVVAGNYIVTCGDDEQVIVSNLQDLSVNYISKCNNSIRCISCSGQYIFTAGWDLLLKVWVINCGKLELACQTKLLMRPKSIALTSNDGKLEKLVYIAVLGQKGSFEVFSFEPQSNCINSLLYN